MPTWGEILGELQASAQGNNGQPDFDGIRRKYLAQLNALTERPVILYTTDWLSGGSPGSSIVLEDMQGMMEVCKGLDGPDLDLILHSPGGSAEATASIVRYLRSKYSDIRVFVPLAAMSAATMWALAGDRIVMGKHSQLGPIDPQVITAQGQHPARAIIDQFDKAKAECAADPSLLGAWLPILQQYGPALLEQCERAEQLSRRLVKEWLESYMFAGRDDASEKAEAVAAYLPITVNTNLIHSALIGRSARSWGLRWLTLRKTRTSRTRFLACITLLCTHWEAKLSRLWRTTSVVLSCRLLKRSRFRSQCRFRSQRSRQFRQVFNRPANRDAATRPYRGPRRSFRITAASSSTLGDTWLYRSAVMLIVE